MTPASTSLEDKPVRSVEPVISATIELIVGLGVFLLPPSDDAEVGERDGRRVGATEIEGETVGGTDGEKDGWQEGRKVGVKDGWQDGWKVGTTEGEKVGARVYEQKGFSEEYRVFLSVSVIE